MSLQSNIIQSNIIDRSGNLDQTRAVPFLTAVSGLVGKIGDEPVVRKCRSRASRQVLIGDQQKTAKALGSEVPPMLLGRRIEPRRELSPNSIA
jgi:hypothetical protein